MADKHTQYCLGFLFSEDKSKVLLILKNRPEWQEGLLNGIGGHLEGSETPLDAMIREFNEEAGLNVLDWDQFHTMKGDDFTVYCFRAFSNEIFNAKSCTDEIITIVNTLNIMNLNTISNLQWLIPMCIDEGFYSFSNYY